jgi:hypothetical protein
MLILNSSKSIHIIFGKAKVFKVSILVNLTLITTKLNLLRKKLKMFNMKIRVIYFKIKIIVIFSLEIS